MPGNSYAIESIRRRAGLDGADVAHTDPPNLPIDPLEARVILEELINEEKDGSVVRIVAGMELDPYWVDLAIIALVRIGEWSEATRNYDFAVAYAGDRTTLPRKAMVAALFGLLSPLQGKELVPQAMLPEDAEKFADHILLDIDRRISALRSGLGIKSGLDRDLCIYTVQLLALLGRPDRASDAVRLLLDDVEPVPKILVALMESELLPAEGDVPNRVRLDYPEDLAVLKRASVIEGRVLRRPKPAFDELLKKRYLAKTDAELIELEGVLSWLADISGDDEAKRLVRSLREFWSFSDPRLNDLTRAMELIEANKLTEAETIVANWRDENDPAWLRVSAALQIVKGNERDAAETLFKCAQLNPHWLAFVGAAELAFSCQDWDLARRSLEEALYRNPTNPTIRNNLITVCERQDRLEDVEHLLKDALSTPRANLSHRLMYARFLMERGRYGGALETLSDDPELVDNDLGAVLLKAELLRIVDGPESAQKYVDMLEDRFLQAKQYWFALLDLSYAAGDDKRGDEALRELVSLKDKGLVSDKELWSKSIDELRAIVEAQRDRHDQAMKHIATGKIPWLMESEMNGVSSWLTWTMRTQPLVHLWDQPSQKVEYSVYATNGFTIDRDEHSIGHFVPITAPKEGSCIVVDASALITLTQLDFLDYVGKYFKQVFVPRQISILMIGESRRLRPNQKSEFDTASALVQGLREKKIQTLEQPIEEFEGVILDPYRVWKYDGSIGYKPILDLIRKSGNLAEAEYQKSKDILRDDYQETDEKTGLRLGSNLLVEETALRMISRGNLLSVILDNFRVHLVLNDVDELQSQVRGYEALSSARQANERLASWIRDGENVHVSSSVVDEEGLSKNWVTEAYQISKQRNVPLLADDRVWHAVRSNELGRGEGVVFDSSAFIRALSANGNITAEMELTAFLTLIEWRYKFLIVPADVMYLAALQYRTGLPGNMLRRIAQYIHDSGSDTALFGGLEPVQPPASIAMRWALSWISEVAKFLVMVWVSESIEIDQRSQLTAWTARCMLPSTVASISPLQLSRLLNNIPMAVLSNFAMEGLQHESIESIQQGFRVFARSLGLDKDEIDRIIEDLIQRATAHE